MLEASTSSLCLPTHVRQLCTNCLRHVFQQLNPPEGTVVSAGLAASIDMVGVSLGGILGHAICTGVAVLGGRQLAAHIREKTVAVRYLATLVPLHHFILNSPFPQGV